MQARGEEPRRAAMAQVVKGHRRDALRATHRNRKLARHGSVPSWLPIEAGTDDGVACLSMTKDQQLLGLLKLEPVSLCDCKAESWRSRSCFTAKVGESSRICRILEIALAIKSQKSVK
jgi:hypothetical protein